VGGPSDLALSPSSCTTTLKPRARVQSSSSTEMSNEMLVTASHTPGPSPPTRASIAAKKLVTFRWRTITPLGRPVEPEVKMT
jgi:hypothetical protein